MLVIFEIFKIYIFHSAHFLFLYFSHKLTKSIYFTQTKGEENFILGIQKKQKFIDH